MKAYYGKRRCNLQRNMLSLFRGATVPGQFEPKARRKELSTRDG